MNSKKSYVNGLLVPKKSSPYTERLGAPAGATSSTRAPWRRSTRISSRLFLSTARKSGVTPRLLRSWLAPLDRSRSTMRVASDSWYQWYRGAEQARNSGVSSCRRSMRTMSRWTAMQACPSTSGKMSKFCDRTASFAFPASHF